MSPCLCDSPAHSVSRFCPSLQPGVFCPRKKSSGKRWEMAGKAGKRRETTPLFGKQRRFGTAFSHFRPSFFPPFPVIGGIAPAPVSVPGFIGSWFPYWRFSCCQSTRAASRNREAIVSPRMLWFFPPQTNHRRPNFSTGFFHVKSDVGRARAAARPKYFPL